MKHRFNQQPYLLVTEREAMALKLELTSNQIKSGFKISSINAK